MELSWMGRYRTLIMAIVRNRNLYARAVNAKTETVGGKVSLTIQEWGVLEYAIENEDRDESMVCVSERLGLAQSSFSKLIHNLCATGLVAKYQMVGNKKNIIVRATELGKKFYLDHSSQLEETIFSGFFKELEGLSDEDIAHVERAIAQLDAGLCAEQIKPKPSFSQLIRLK